MTAAKTIIDSTIPGTYNDASREELIARIRKVKEEMAERLIILGHHYQVDDIYDLSDFHGDSFELARKASEAESRYIVFCGVRFMAESARILARKEQRVFHPNDAAGCPMADMVTLGDLLTCWKYLDEHSPGKKIIPITYMNSNAEIKAFCGEHGGIVCTSSNAHAALKWAYERGDVVLFLPDEHLGRNTAMKMKIPVDEIAEWDFRKRGEETDFDSIEEARIVLWKGFCHVHANHFGLETMKSFRNDHPEGKIVVHPEVPYDLTKHADAVGSTSFILKYVESLPEKSVVAVGTEVNMVLRMQKKYEGRKEVVPLEVSRCHHMARIDLPHLAWCLENLPCEGEVILPESITQNALTSLQRMLAIPRDW